MILESLLIGIVLTNDFRDCPSIGIDWTMCLVLSIHWNCPDKRSRTLPINWNCPENCFHRVSINWNCLNNWCLVLQLFGIVQTNFLGDSINWNCPENCFTGCLLIVIAWTIDVWCFQLIGPLQTSDVGDCLLIGIVLKIVFTGCLLIGIACTIDFGWCTWIEIGGTTVGTTAFGDRPLIGMIRTIEF